MSSTEQRMLDAARAALDGERRVLLAVSGGLDSMTLLDVAARVVDAPRILVATFDHGTGAAATDAVNLVMSRAAELGVRCELGQATQRLRSEADLRDARWTFLRGIAHEFGTAIATAHSLDDQVETVLMRVMRGAGARGLAGLYAPGVALRPFIAFARAELARYAHARELRWVEDPSNASPAYFRNRVRHDLLPALSQVHPELPRDLLAIAERAAQWRKDVDAFVANHLSARPAGGRSFEVALEPLAEMSVGELSALWPAIAARFGLTLDRRGIARLSAFTRDGRAGAQIQLSGGWSAVRARDALTLTASREGPPAPKTIERSGRTVWGAWSFRPRLDLLDVSENEPWTCQLPLDALLTVRVWRPGDRIRQKTGGPRTVRKVKELLSRAGVTGHKRAGWPVVLADDEIVWVPGVDVGGATVGGGGEGGGGSNITERLGTAGVLFVCEYFDC